MKKWLFVICVMLSAFICLCLLMFILIHAGGNPHAIPKNAFMNAILFSPFSVVAAFSLYSTMIWFIGTCKIDIDAENREYRICRYLQEKEDRLITFTKFARLLVNNDTEKLVKDFIISLEEGEKVKKEECKDASC